MMKYPLEDLLKVRFFREDAADQEVRASRTRFEQAVAAAERARREVAEYAVWRVDQEDKLFEQVRGREVAVQDLEDFKAVIALLREREVQLEKSVTDADKAVDAARADATKAREAYAAAVRERKKIDEHKALWAADARKEEEAAQDRETEDFKSRGAAGQDDEDGEEDEDEGW